MSDMTSRISEDKIADNVRCYIHLADLCCILKVLEAVYGESYKGVEYDLNRAIRQK
jgi:hypothetical protein